MIKVAMVKENGEVGYIISPAVDSDYIDRQVYGDYTAMLISADSNDDDYIVRKYWDGDAWADKGERPTDFHEWVSGAWVLNISYLFNQIRAERTKRLAFSDWTQMPDSSLSDSKKAAWVAYRQALRDVPANYSEINSLDEVSWPTVPGG